ncbi:hypothetical protein [Spirosoma sp. KNUC1025]|uniref:hypothetical protein n=1 Tax=Spirosoma sp. KNUC1025 TaxID=2894082 RepID=UPI001E3AA3EF|nr:hypothetical protein [Spirosoma sp. KNUC1025]UFH57724.1 hypothetical protein LN737_32365 [Spirosoma sp. KNUC1025]
MKRVSLRLMAYSLLLGTLIHCKQAATPIPDAPSPTRDDNLALGNPSGAEPSPFSPNNFLVTRSTYSLSYNNSTGIANWCSRCGGPVAPVSSLERLRESLHG